MYNEYHSAMNYYAKFLVFLRIYARLSDVIQENKVYYIGRIDAL